MTPLRTILREALFLPAETKPRPAREVAMAARNTERRERDRRAAERLYPERNEHV